MPRYRSHSVAFKKQVVQEFLAGESVHALGKRHDLCRNLIRIWIGKYEAGEFDDEVVASDQLQAYEAKIAALERMVGRLTMELEFVKGASRSRPPPRSETMSLVSGPAASPSRGDAR